MSGTFTPKENAVEQVHVTSGGEEGEEMMGGDNNNNNLSKQNSRSEMRKKDEVQDDEALKNSNKRSARKPREKPCYSPTLRTVIGGLGGLAVLVVAATVLAIASTLFTDAAKNVGKRYTLSLIRGARDATEDYFERSVSEMDAIAIALQTTKSGVVFPSDDPTMNSTRFCEPFRAVHAASNYSHSSIGAFMDDGSLFAAALYNITDPIGPLISCFMISSFNGSNSNRGIYSETNFYSDTLLPVPAGIIPLSATVPGPDQKPASYTVASAVAKQEDTVFFAPLSAFREHTFAEAYLTFSAARAFYNRSGTFMGILAMATSTATLETFLLSLERTENTHGVMLDGSLNLLASTHPSPVSTTYVQSVSLPVPTGCLTTNDVSASPTPSIVCLTKATDYPYAPVATLMRDDPTFVSSPTPVTKDITADGETYIVAASAIPSTARTFSLSVAFFAPSSDVLGGIIDARNFVIIIACAIFVLAVVVAVVIVILVLKPLENVAKQMDDTSKLKLRDDEHNSNAAGGTSSIDEIYSLEAAYANMAVALGSFTKYVDKAVVRDLLQSGQLCKIGMVPMESTILFANVAEFNGICERVPPEDLNKAITVYFDRMTSVLMSTGSIIDKIIINGDTLMSGWGTVSFCANQELKAAVAGLLMERETKAEPLLGTFDTVGENLTINIGINSGIVMNGNMGSSQRLSYTSIGDNVNLASRLESSSKQFGIVLGISEFVERKCRSILATRAICPMQVVGKAEAVMVYELVGLKPDLDVDKLLDKKEERGNASISVASVDNLSVATGATGATGGGGESYISSRAGANITANALLKAAQKYEADKNSSIVVTPFELNFCQVYSSAVNTFADGNPQQALNILERLKSDADMACFFKSDPTEARERCGEHRAAASVIRADISAQVLEKVCKRCINDPPKNKSGFILRLTDK